MGLSTNNNSVFELKYKLIMRIKDITCIDKEYFLEKVELMFEDISKKYGVTKGVMDFKENALWVKFSAKPNTELSKFINAYKSATSRRVKKDLCNSDIKEFWDKGYLLLTVGDDDDEIIKRYI